MKTHSDPESSQPEHWLDEYGDYLYGYAHFRLGNDPAVEDIVQETLLAAFRGWDRFEGRSSVKTWLTSILNRKIIDHFRVKARERKHFAPEFPDPEFEGEFTPEGRIVPEHGAKLWSRRPDDATEKAEFWEVLTSCLENVPPGAREAYIGREIHGETTDEICKAQDITPGNLWVILHRVRKSLRKCLEVRWFGR